MDARQRQFLIDAHRDSLHKHGYSPMTLFWESRGLQWVRFRVLSEIGIGSGDSLLDVGCGFGDLRSWLLAQGIEVEYTGIDLSPDLVEKARTLHARAQFYEGDIFDLEADAQSFDWVLLSGTLNWQLHDDGDYARRVIVRMYELCRKGVAFNMLNAQCWSRKQLFGLVAFDPDLMLDFCRQLTPDCHLRCDYADRDFTIYMRRSDV